MKNKTRISAVLALGLGATLAGCGDSTSGNPNANANPNVGTPINYQHGGDGTTSTAASAGLSYTVGTGSLVDPTVDYMQALRTASLKLRGTLPSLDEQLRLQSIVSTGTANDAQLQYESMVRGYIYNSPATFNRQMFYFWRNTLRMGGPTPITGLFSNSNTDTRTVDLDSAPAFAAMLVSTDQPMTTLFTAPDPACPSFNLVTGTFTPGNCNNPSGATVGTKDPGNNVPAANQAGILTNPAFLAQYYSNFGFRRARLINELFACTRYPAELTNMPQQLGPYLYTSPWPVDSVTNAGNGFQPVFLPIRPRRMRGGGTDSGTDFVDFRHDCQDCHSTLNHRAPMFGIFDQVGYRDPNNLLMVTSTANNAPFASVQEYLYECNPQATDTMANPTCPKILAWRYGGPTFDFAGTPEMPNFQAFGQAMASDPQVIQCFMQRAWNYAYSHDDIVNDLALVPDDVVADLTTYFVQNNYNMRAALLKLYTDPNFIRF